MSFCLTVFGVEELPARENMDQVVKKALSNKDIQTELPCITDKKTNPACKDFVPPKPPGWLAAIFKAIGKFFDIFGPVLKYIIWGGLILLTGLGIYYFIDKFKWNGGRPESSNKIARKEIRRAATAPKDRQTRPPTLEDADKMAARGNFADAVHFLLLASIDYIQNKLKGLLEISETSREISQNNIIAERDRLLLSPMVRQVEKSLFAHIAPERDDFEECRIKYLELTGQEGGAK